MGSLESQHNYQGQAFLEERTVFTKAYRTENASCVWERVRILYRGKNEHDRKNNRGKFRVE